MKGYKAFNLVDGKLNCRGYVFDEFAENNIIGDIKLCENGFHFCTEIHNCLNYYDITKNLVICEIEANGTVISDEAETKYVCGNLKIIRRISDVEILKSLPTNYIQKFINANRVENIIDFDMSDVDRYIIAVKNPEIRYKLVNSISTMTIALLWLDKWPNDINLFQTNKLKGTKYSIAEWNKKYNSTCT